MQLDYLLAIVSSVFFLWPVDHSTKMYFFRNLCWHPSSRYLRTMYPNKPYQSNNLFLIPFLLNHTLNFLLVKQEIKSLTKKISFTLWYKLSWPTIRSTFQKHEFAIKMLHHSHGKFKPWNQQHVKLENPQHSSSNSFLCEIRIESISDKWLSHCLGSLCSCLYY